MYATRVPVTKQSAAQLSKAVASISHCHGYTTSTTGLRLGSIQIHNQISKPRHFSSTPQRQLKDIFPKPDAPQILKTEPAWPHEP